MATKKEEWPNGRGYDIHDDDGGEWSYWKPDGSRKHWGVNYIPPGEMQATLHGEGETPEAARANAKPIE